MAHEQQVGNDFLAMSKDVVTASRSLTLAARNAATIPMIDWMKSTPAGALVVPLIEMARETQDRILESWEHQSHQMIEASFRMMEGQRHATHALVRTQPVADAITRVQASA